MFIATAAQSREIDRRAIEEFGITSQRLMEAAGAEVYASLPAMSKVTILCGQGNNGGDGFVVASLAARSGKTVTCLVAASESELSPDAARQLEQAKRSRVRPIFAGEAGWADALEAMDEADVIVDALLGTGSRGPIEGYYLEAILAANATDVPVVSVDIPSGIDCDTGNPLGEAIWAHTTVTFGLPKPFLFASEGPDHAGIWRVADIGFPPALLEEPTGAFLVDTPWASDRMPLRWHTSHKGTSGHLVILAGSSRYRGAAALACSGALRSGVGLITLAASEAVCASVAAQMSEITFLPLDEQTDAHRAVIEAIGRADAVVVGPGLTTEARPLLEIVFPQLDKPNVLDADALNLIAEGLMLPPGPSVLTPHPGEMGRLLFTNAHDVQHNRFGSVKAFGRGKTMLLKGASSLVWEANMATAVCPSGNPGMATAGMGDVLAGVVGSLLAQGLTPYDAAACGGALHSMAGDMAGAEIGPIGYSAWDLSLRLPKARAKITAG